MAQNPLWDEPCGDPPMALLALGVNHKNAPVEVRERLAFEAGAIPGALSSLSSRKGVREAAILSTCNRTELYCNLHEGGKRGLADWLAGYHGLREDSLLPYLYAHPGQRAVRHVMRVASGLDSMVVGEPQVLGQLKLAYEAALDAGTVGPLLNRLFQHSFSAAKQVRSSTAIGHSPLSVAAVAVKLARQVCRLSDSSVLLVGAGETIEIAARRLRQENIRRMIVANRTLETAQRLAQACQGYAIHLAAMPDHLAEADIVLCCTGSRTPVLSMEAVAKAGAARKHKPMFLVDLAVPRDIDPRVADLEEAYLYTVDDLEQVIDRNLDDRKEAAREAEEIIRARVSRFMEWLQGRQAVPDIRALRERAWLLREQALEDAERQLSNGTPASEVLRRVTRALTGRLLHLPTVSLRAGRSDGGRETE
ncbi:MAG: glutamyl-tRNA reductase [Gammaproteobacteria bacterium]|nr:glutamyl-tRNA reductase [Gammaproteobacteria bacterium]